MTNSFVVADCCVVTLAEAVTPRLIACSKTVTQRALVGAMMLEQNDEWSLNRRYMQLEGLQTLSDTVPTRLSAVAR